MTTIRHRRIDTPLGTMLLAVDDSGALTGAWFEGQRHAPAESSLGPLDDTIAGDAVAQLGEYFAGHRATFDLRLAPSGTDFQQRVWQQLRAIPTGATTTYGQLAASLDMVPGASRAVGAATGRNPISVIVPCHRLVGADGSLTGYAGGLERKRWLLDHEAAMTGTSTEIV